MPTKPKKPCKYNGCPNLTDGVYCKEHEKKMNKNRLRNKEAMKIYNCSRRGYDSNKRYGNRWKKIRAWYVSIHPLCEECAKRGRYVLVEEVHHIKPLSEGGTNEASNLMSLCRKCHEKKHQELERRGYKNL